MDEPLPASVLPSPLGWCLGGLFQLGRPGEVMPRLGLMAAPGSGPQGWTQMWWEAEGAGAAQVLSSGSRSLLG